MKRLLIGKARGAKNSNPLAKRATKECGNKECSNTFISTENGKQQFCSPKCRVKAKGRKNTWPNKKKYQKEFKAKKKAEKVASTPPTGIA